MSFTRASCYFIAFVYALGVNANSSSATPLSVLISDKSTFTANEIGFSNFALVSSTSSRRNMNSHLGLRRSFRQIPKLFFLPS